MPAPLRIVVDSLRASFAPLGMRGVRLYFAGQTVSLLGDWMQMTAQAWVTWELSHSAAVLGTTAMLRFLPMLLLAPWSGTLADRLDRRRVLIGTNIAAMLLAFVLAVLVQTEAVRIWHLYVLSALLGIVTALDLPVEQAFVGDLSGMTRVRHATVLNMIMVQATRTVGPALAGWIIASLGAALAFWLNGTSFVAVIASLLAVQATQERDTGDDGSLAAFKEGLRFVRQQPRVLDLVLFTLLITFFAISAATVLPAVVTQNLGGQAEALGLLMGSSGAGAVLGAVLVTPLAQRVRRAGLMFAAALVWTGLWITAFSFSARLGPAAAACFLWSVTFPVVVATANGLLQVLAPPDMRGRLLTVLLMTSFGAQPIASLAVGWSAQVFGAMAALRINGLLMMAGAGLLLAVRRGLWGWEVEPPAPGEQERQPEQHEAHQRPEPRGSAEAAPAGARAA